MTHTLIIGGTRGMGRAVVRAFLPEGPVSVVGKRPPYDADRVPGILHKTADVTDNGALIPAVAEIVAENGPVGNLIFVLRYRGQADDWTGNLVTGLEATRRLIDHMASDRGRMGGGSIVIVSSIASTYIVQEQSIGFHIVKAASDQLVRYYAVKLGPGGFRVNGINPGRLIKGESKDYYDHNERLKKMYEAVSPLRRIGTADEMASVIKFLCSPGASYVTGQCIVLDGGLSLHGHDSIVRLALAAEGISLA